MIKNIIICLCCTLLLSACEKPPEFTISNVIIKEMPPGRAMAVAYLRIENFQDTNLVLNYIHTPVAESVAVHRSLYEGGMMKMREVKHLSVNAGNAIVFQPRSFHLMLIGVERQLKDGELVPLTFEFEGFAPRTVVAEVQRL